MLAKNTKINRRELEKVGENQAGRKTVEYSSRVEQLNSAVIKAIAELVATGAQIRKLEANIDQFTDLQKELIHDLIHTFHTTRLQLQSLDLILRKRLHSNPEDLTRPLRSYHATINRLSQKLLKTTEQIDHNFQTQTHKTADQPSVDTIKTARTLQEKTVGQLTGQLLALIFCLTSLASVLAGCSAMPSRQQEPEPVRLSQEEITAKNLHEACIVPPREELSNPVDQVNAGYEVKPVVVIENNRPFELDPLIREPEIDKLPVLVFFVGYEGSEDNLNRDLKDSKEVLEQVFGEFPIDAQYFTKNVNVGIETVERSSWLTPKSVEEVSTALQDKFPAINFKRIYIVNTEEYLGAANDSMMVLSNDYLPRVLVHELGHMLGNLGDEYNMFYGLGVFEDRYTSIYTSTATLKNPYYPQPANNPTQMVCDGYPVLRVNQENIMAELETEKPYFTPQQLQQMRDSIEKEIRTNRLASAASPEGLPTDDFAFIINNGRWFLATDSSSSTGQDAEAKLYQYYEGSLQVWEPDPNTAGEMYWKNVFTGQLSFKNETIGVGDLTLKVVSFE